MAVTTFLTNDQWAERKDYANMAAYTAGNNPTPGATSLNKFREDAFYLMSDRIGSVLVYADLTTLQKGKLQAIEYQVVEKLRLKEVVKKTKEAAELQKEIDALLSLIPQEVARDLSLDPEDGKINRGVTEG